MRMLYTAQEKRRQITARTMARRSGRRWGDIFRIRR